VIERPPCHGLTDLFVPSLKEIAEQDGSNHYDQAKAICATCPADTKRLCAARGLMHRDTMSVRAGLRLWLPEERALLRRAALPSTKQETTTP
jgi:hypothetical protein